MKDKQSEDTTQLAQSQLKSRAYLIAKQNAKIQTLDDKAQQLITSPAYALKILALELLLEGDIERAAEYVDAALSIDEKILDDLERDESTLPLEILGYQNFKIFLAERHKSSESIIKDTKENYMFIRLIQQDFIKAYRLFKKLISGDDLQENEAIEFVLLNKYNYRYEILIAFLLRLIYQNSVEKSAKELLWDALFFFNADWIGIRHAQLMIRALEESRRLDKLLVDQLADWVFASLTSRNPETSWQHRSRLAESFSVCPTVTQHIFNRLIRRSRSASAKGLWEGLAVRPRKNLLVDYWLPLLGYLPEEYTTFLITLITEYHLGDEVSVILKSVDWTALKKIPLRKKPLFAAVSKCIEDTCSKRNSEAALKNLLPVWLSLLEEGDNPIQLVILLEQRNEPWLRWAIRLVKAILDPTQQADLLDHFLSILENQHPDRESILLLSPVICDWGQPRNEVLKICWFLLNEQDPVIFQRAVQRFDRSLDKSEDNDAPYQQLQETIWQHRHWPTSSKAPIPYRKERFALLLETLQHEDLDFIWHAQGTIQLCDSDQWNREESRQLITILMKQIHHNENKSALKALGALAHHQFNEVIPALLNTTMYRAILDWDVIVILRKLIHKYPIHVIPLLLEGLKNPKWGVRRTSAEILGYTDQEHILEVIPALLEMLKDLEYLVRATAAEKLGQVGEHHADKVIPALLETLKDLEYSVRAAAAETLGRVGKHHADKVLPALMTSVNDADLSVRKSVVKALGHFAHQCADEVIPVLQQALKDPDSYVRTKAAKALTQVGQSHANEVISIFMSAIEDQSSPIRVVAVNALGQFAQQHANEVVPVLLRMIIVDYSSDITCAIIKALGEIIQHYAREVVPVLLEVMKNKHTRSRFLEETITALGKVSQDHAGSVIPVLLEALKAEEFSTFSTATRAVEKVGRYHISNLIPADAVGRFGKHHASREIFALVSKIKRNDKIVELNNVFISLEKLAEFHTNETLTFFLNTIKKKSYTFMTRWMPGSIRNYDALPEYILGELRAVLIKITHCPRSYIFPLVDGSPKSKDSSYTRIMLPLLCNYNLQLPLTILPEENSLIPLSELVIAVAQLADPKQRATTASQLREYYALHKTQFIHQLADILQQQLTCVPDIVLLCQLLNITSIIWLSDLSTWFKNKKSQYEWRFPLACLAQLLCDEGSSISLSDVYQLIICQPNGPIFLHTQFEAKFVIRLFEEVQFYLKSIGLPYPALNRLFIKYPVRNMPGFFSEPKQIPTRNQSAERETEKLLQDKGDDEWQNQRVLLEVVGDHDSQIIRTPLFDESSVHTIEWVLNRLNQEKYGSQLSQNRQTALLCHLAKANGEFSKNLSYVGRLEFHDFHGLTQMTLLPVILRFTRLQSLSLYNSFDLFFRNPFNKIFITCQYLLEIMLSDVNILYIDSGLGSSLEAKLLIKFTLIRCYRLSAIVISAPMLRELTITDCANLNTIKFIGSLSLLHTLILDKCPSLTKILMNPMSLKVIRFSNLQNMRSINEEFRRYLVSFLKKFGSDPTMAKSNGAVISMLHMVGQSFEIGDEKHPDFDRDDLKNLVIDTADLIALRISGFDLSGSIMSNVTLEQSSLIRLSFDNASFSNVCLGPKIIWEIGEVHHWRVHKKIEKLVFLPDDNHIAICQADGYSMLLNCDQSSVRQFPLSTKRDKLERYAERFFLGGIAPPYFTVYYPGMRCLLIYKISQPIPNLPTIEQLSQCHADSDFNTKLHLLFYRADLFFELISAASYTKFVNMWIGKDAICSTTMSHDGEWVAIGNLHGDIYLWSFKSVLGEKTLLRSKSGTVTALSYAPNDLRIVSGHADNSIQLWDCKTAECLWVYEGHTRSISVVAFSHGGKKFASAALDGTVRIWNTREHYPYLYRGKRNGPLTINNIETDDIVGLDDSTLELMRWGGHEFNLKIIKITNSRYSIKAPLIDTITPPYDVNSVSCLRFSHASKLLAVGRRDGMIIIWDHPKKNYPKFDLIGHRSRIKSMIFSLDDRILITGSLDATIRIWSMDNGEMLNTLIGHTNSVNSLSLSYTNLLVSGSNDGTIKIWDLYTGGCIQTILNANDIMDPAASRLLSFNSKGMLKFGSLNSSNSFSNQNLAVTHVAIDADGSRIASSDTSSTIKIFAISTGTMLLRRPPDRTADKLSMIIALTFSPDAKYLLSSSNHGTTLVIRVIDGAIVRRIINKEMLTTDTLIIWKPAMIVSYNRYNSNQVNIVRFSGGICYQFTANLNGCISALAVDFFGDVIAVSYTNGKISLHVISDLPRKVQRRSLVFSLLECLDIMLPLSHLCDDLDATCVYSLPGEGILAYSPDGVPTTPYNLGRYSRRYSPKSEHRYLNRRHHRFWLYAKGIHAYGLCNGRLVIKINNKLCKPQNLVDDVCVLAEGQHYGAILSIRVGYDGIFTGGADATIRIWHLYGNYIYAADKYRIYYCGAPVTCFGVSRERYVAPSQGCKLEIGDRSDTNLTRIYDITSPAIDIDIVERFHAYDDDSLIVIVIQEGKILLMNWQGDLLKITSFNSSVFWRSEFTAVTIVEKEKWLRKTDDSSSSLDKFKFFKMPKNPSEDSVDFSQNEYIECTEANTETSDGHADILGSPGGVL